jgi:hypothetical protein
MIAGYDLNRSGYKFKMPLVKITAPLPKAGSINEK